jgi:acyl-CoA thioester hydrolase
MTAMTELSGRFEGKTHVFPIRVYYEDTDFSGAVYHANYLKYCERARTECLRLLDIHHSRIDASFMVRRMACDFRKSAGIDDLLEVRSEFLEFAGARMEMLQQVWRGDDVIFHGDVTGVLVNPQGRPTRIPKEMAEAFAQYLKHPPLTDP